MNASAMEATGTASPKTEFFGSLESLRGVAALLVALHHLPPWTDRIYDLPLIRHGYLMVNLFFVLSGFVLFHSYGKRLHSTAELGMFVKLRLGRLYPVHLAFFLPFVGIELLKFASPQLSPSAFSLAKSVFANVFLLQGVGLFNVDPMLNFPSWSISTEFYTYLIFAFVMLAVPRRSFSVAAASLILGCVVALFAVDLGLYEKMVRCVAGFFFGCLTRIAFDKLRGLRVSGLWSLGVLLLMTVVLAAPWHESRQTATSWEQLSMPLTGALLLSIVLAPDGWLNRLLSLRSLRWLGEVSYSLYMSHALVLWVVRQGCRSVLKLPDEVVQGITTARLTTLQAAFMYPAVVLAMLVLAGISYRWLEAPARDAVRRYIKRTSVELVPAARSDVA